MFPPAPPPPAPPAPRGPGEWPFSLALLALALLVGAIAVREVAGGGTERAGSRTAAPAGPSASPSPAFDGCEYLEIAEPNDDGTLPGLPPAEGILTEGTVTATIHFTRGPLTVELYADRAPCAVHSFLFLARNDFFDDTVCHRLSTREVHALHCGDPSGLGNGGPGYHFERENEADTRYVAGTLATASYGELDHGGSQFFFVHRDSPIRPRHTIFGRVVGGMDVLAGVAAGGVAKGAGDGFDGRPAIEARIRDVATT